VVPLYYASAAYLVYFYLRYVYPLRFHQDSAYISEKAKPISLIVAAKNEADNLKQNLPAWLEQDYPDFEIIIVNDHSTDNSVDVVKSFESTKLKLVELDSGTGKKAAVKAGIEEAKYDRLVFTDADCWPASDQWLKELSVALLNHKIVLGHGRYKKEKGFLNALIRFESLQVAVNYFSLAFAGKTYMGVGRNLAYHKTVFQESKSFVKHGSIRSGDDDLLVNEMGKKVKVEIKMNPDSQTFSEAKKTWKEYIIQKRRHMQAGTKYKTSDRLSLALIGLSQLFFYIGFIWLLVFSIFPFTILVIFAIKQLMQLFIFKKSLRKLGDKDLWLIWPFLEFVYLLVISFIGVSTWIVKVDRWK
jgi:glycosyltransferase involved in cell wall biosynthesis